MTKKERGVALFREAERLFNFIDDRANEHRWISLKDRYDCIKKIQRKLAAIRREGQKSGKDYVMGGCVTH